MFCDYSMLVTFVQNRWSVLSLAWQKWERMKDLLLRARAATSFPGFLFSASLSRWNRDPGCGWSRDYLSIQNRRVGWYSNIFGREDDKIPHPSSRFSSPPDSWWSRDPPQPGSLFQLLREAEKRDPGNEVAHAVVRNFKHKNLAS